jgi:hypothetical protein
MNNSISLFSLFRPPPSYSTASLHSNGSDSFSREGDISHGSIYSIGSSPQRRPGRPPSAYQDAMNDLPTSQSLQSTTSWSNNHGHTRRMSISSASSAMTVRPFNATPSRRRSRRTHRPSISVSSSTTHTCASQGPRRSLASRSGCSTSGRIDGQQRSQLHLSRSHASIKTRSTHRSSRRRRKTPSPDIINRVSAPPLNSFLNIKRS